MTPRRKIGPAGRQERPQPDRHRYLAPRRAERARRLAVRPLARRPAILGCLAARRRLLLRQRGVIDHQNRIVAADQATSTLCRHLPQRCVIPGRTAHEAMQLVMVGQAEPGCDRLYALRPVRLQEPAHLDRPPLVPPAAAHHPEKRLQPYLNAPTKPRHPGRSTYSTESQPNTQFPRNSTSAKVAPVSCSRSSLPQAANERDQPALKTKKQCPDPGIIFGIETSELGHSGGRTGGTDETPATAPKISPQFSSGATTHCFAIFAHGYNTFPPRKMPQLIGDRRPGRGR